MGRHADTWGHIHAKVVSVSTQHMIEIRLQGSIILGFNFLRVPFRSNDCQPPNTHSEIPGIPACYPRTERIAVPIGLV